MTAAAAAVVLSPPQNAGRETVLVKNSPCLCQDYEKPDEKGGSGHSKTCKRKYANACEDHMPEKIEHKKGKKAA